MDIQNLGRIIAPESVRVWDGKDAGEWVAFMNIDGLHVDGNGVVDGSGKPWWDQSCRYHPQLVYIIYIYTHESSINYLFSISWYLVRNFIPIGFSGELHNSSSNCK